MVDDDPRDAELAGLLAEHAEEVEARLATLPLPSWGSLETQRPQIRAHGLRLLGTTCAYCHDEIVSHETVLCQACLAAHHEPCFAQHASCAAPGCGSKRYLRSTTLGAPRRSRLGWVLGVALSAGAGAAAWASFGGGAPTGTQQADRVDAQPVVDKPVRADWEGRILPLLVVNDWHGATRELEAELDRQVDNPPLHARAAKLRDVVVGLAVSLADPESAAWDDLAHTTRVARLANAGNAFAGWLSQVEARVTASESARLALGRVEVMLDHAREQLDEPDVALVHLGRASAILGRVEPGHYLDAALAEAQATVVDLAWRSPVNAVERELKRKDGNWDRASEWLARATDFDGGAHAQEIQLLKRRLHANRTAEIHYTDAVRIVNGRRVEDYPKAVELLEAIHAEAPIYADARAYLDWIAADLDVREATRAYQAGDERRAFELLDRALGKEVLGQEAKNSVRQRKQRWARVAASFGCAMGHLVEGKQQAAAAEFEALLVLEANVRNRFHALARAEVERLRTPASTSARALWVRAGEHLRAGEFAAAARWYEIASTRQGATAGDRAKIREAAGELFTAWGKAPEATRASLPDAFCVGPFLDAWLPKDDPRRAQVGELLTALEQRLAAVAKAAEDDWAEDDDWGESDEWGGDWEDKSQEAPKDEPR